MCVLRKVRASLRLMFTEKRHSPVSTFAKHPNSLFLYLTEIVNVYSGKDSTNQELN